jgi:hypothetical protein
LVGVIKINEPAIELVLMILNYQNS